MNARSSRSKRRRMVTRAMLEPHTRSLFLAALTAGNRVAIAARIAGLNPKTVEEWLRRGQGVDDRPSEPAYRRLYEEVEHAKAMAEVHAVAAIRNGMERDPRLAIWFLENRSPEWRRRREHPTPEPQPAPSTPSPRVIVIEREELEQMGLQRVRALRVDNDDQDDRLSSLVEDSGPPTGST
jgi:hypothetical protein